MHASSSAAQLHTQTFSTHARTHTLHNNYYNYNFTYNYYLKKITHRRPPSADFCEHGKAGEQHDSLEQLRLGRLRCYWRNGCRGISEAAARASPMGSGCKNLCMYDTQARVVTMPEGQSTGTTPAARLKVFMLQPDVSSF